MAFYDITIRLEIPDEVTGHPVARRGLEALADVMLVQAEDGLYSAGYPEADTILVHGLAEPNAYVAPIQRSKVVSILHVAADVEEPAVLDRIC